ncbi:MAG: hypothetical protein L0H84_20080 [Pseudonocardia sp.]|nr:hypothetical protein [Pseudonocardia sp.]
MALDHFIPEVWNARLLTSLETNLVYGGPNVVNREYEGDIANAGDTVRITSISDPEISDYVAGVTTITPTPLTTAQRSLVITESKMFAFEVDDVDKRQALGGVMAEGMRRAAYRLRDVADRFLAAKFVGGVQAANLIAATQIVAKDPAAPAIGGQLSAYEGIVRLAQRLDEADIPDTGRWVIIPAWYHALLLLDERFTDASARGEQSAAINGMVGTVAGMMVARSNNAPTMGADDTAVIAGTSAALSYAEQINMTEAYRPESSFSDAVKGLHVYGAKLVRPDHVAVLTASQDAVTP